MIRLGRFQVSLEGLILVVALVVAGSWAGRCAGEQDGATRAALEAALAENDSLKRLQPRVDTLYVAQRDTFVRFRTKWDTARVDVERWKYDTVKVVRYVALADSTIRACSAALLTCEARVALRDRRIAALETAVLASLRLNGRPWTAAGVSYDPVTGRLGAFVDRDVWRGRVGASVQPGRIEVRAGVRW